MSERAAEPTGGEQGSLNLGISPSADTPNEPVTASAAETSPAVDALVSEPSMPEPSTSEPAMFEPGASEAAKVEASAKAPQPEAAKPKGAQLPGKVIVMSRGGRAWTDSGIHVEPDMAEHESVFGRRRIAAIAAVVALATVAGAIGGAFATATFMHGGSDVANNGSQTVLASLSRIDSDIQALKTGLDHTSKLGMGQFNKTSERLDKLERAQAEPSAKIAKLSEAVDKPRTAPAAVPVAAASSPAAAKEATGSIGTATAQQTAAAPGPSKPDVKTEVGRLPTIDGWVLRDVAYGGALIDSRRGMYEVYAGDMVPGLGRVDAIRRQDGHWVVVTSRGLIVAR
ncbi:hypothetical protein [Bradyrhizobium sp.]|uniref:hypothetical protein n=1 Tax=Bradyrhizobium sp. TaxID=376 RepID=UPI003C418177